MLKFSLCRLLQCAATVGVLSAAVTAHATNDGLYISGLTQWAAIAGRPYTFTPQVVNPSGRHLTFGIVNKPSWATLNATTGQLSGTPPDIIKTYSNISISVTDGVTTAKSSYFSIRVYPPNTSDRPSISGAPGTSVTAGSPYTFQPSARDTYGEPLSFSVQNKPAWASFSVATGRLYGTPTSAQAGTYGNVEISVTNGKLAAALPAFSVTVKGSTASSPGKATVNWTRPTKNTNGTALTDLAGYRPALRHVAVKSVLGGATVQCLTGDLHGEQSLSSHVVLRHHGLYHDGRRERHVRGGQQGGELTRVGTGATDDIRNAEGRRA